MKGDSLVRSPESNQSPLTLEAGRAFQFTDHDALSVSRKWERDRPMPMRPPKDKWALRVHWESSGWAPHLASKTNWNTKRPQESGPHMSLEKQERNWRYLSHRNKEPETADPIFTWSESRGGGGPWGQKWGLVMADRNYTLSKKNFLIKVADRRMSCCETWPPIKGEVSIEGWVIWV